MMEIGACKNKNSEKQISAENYSRSFFLPMYNKSENLMQPNLCRMRAGVGGISDLEMISVGDVYTVRVLPVKFSDFTSLTSI